MTHRRQLDFKKLVQRGGYWGGLGLVLGLFHKIAPLYGGNQHEKFLPGLAKAGYGYLSADWRANTTDPLPLFSGLVQFTYAYLGEVWFYIYLVAFLGVYVYSVAGIVNHLFNLSGPRKGAFYLLFFTAHASWLDIALSDNWAITRRELTRGVAFQDLSFGVFLPSNLGALLILSILLFLRGKRGWAVFWLAAAATVHSAYLYPAAFLTAAYMLIVWLEQKDVWAAVTLGGLSALLVAPAMAYNLIFLERTSPETWAQALAILVQDRIPHHTLPHIWFDNSVIVQMVIIVLAVWVARNSPLAWVLGVVALSGLLPTVAIWFRPSNTISFIEPWRVTVFLTPLCWGILAGAVARSGWGKLDEGKEKMISTVLVALLVGLTAWNAVEQYAIFAAPYQDDALDYIEANKQPGEMYLVPPKDSRLYTFRLYTGAPIYTNWQAIPHKDVEVLAWWERVAAAELVYAGEEAEACAALAGIVASDGVTHVVAANDAPLPPCAKIKTVYAGEAYTVYGLGE